MTHEVPHDKDFYHDLLAKIKAGEVHAITNTQFDALKALFPREDYSKLSIIPTPHAGTPGDGDSRTESEGPNFSGR